MNPKSYKKKLAYKMRKAELQSSAHEPHSTELLFGDFREIELWGRVQRVLSLLGSGVSSLESIANENITKQPASDYARGVMYVTVYAFSLGAPPPNKLEGSSACA